ncbi:hypothetical protein C9374_005643 [Naegleria lovaniensis]|uniref:Actin n=1 Tax=Naegleria lovaniensis TaxID=51637 RepID=A0AA88GK48_NAELO|nr:uncharacterized protein C9374_005643 [Naegleria lovaniensis]KAG2382441.1 hypothetical protein C9374_005643 [Naegleria lovaniensis]
MTDFKALMFDLGSGLTKVGFTGEDSPSSVFPTVVGKANQGRLQSIPTLNGTNREMIGDEAVCATYNTLFSPIRHGIIQDYDRIEKILHHCFYNELRVEPEDHPVIMSTRVHAPKAQHEKLTQIMFETFAVPGFYIAQSTLLSMFAAGRNTGIVLDCGDGVTSVETLSNGYHTKIAAKRVNMGGSDLDEYLATLLQERGYYFSTSAELHVVKQIKEKLSYCALDLDAELQTDRMSSKLEKAYELPDGNVISISNERFRCMEALFNPSLIGREDVGIHEMVFNAIQKCDLGVRKDFYGNILLSGGSTFSEGFSDRLVKEITSLAPASILVKVVSPPERKYSVWIGGSILGDLSSFQQYYLSKQEYDDEGPAMIHRKCY